jgi:hypothetical protein
MSQEGLETEIPYKEKLDDIYMRNEKRNKDTGTTLFVTVCRTG